MRSICAGKHSRSHSRFVDGPMDWQRVSTYGVGTLQRDKRKNTRLGANDVVFREGWYQHVRKLTVHFVSATIAGVILDLINTLLSLAACVLFVLDSYEWFEPYNYASFPRAPPRYPPESNLSRIVWYSHGAQLRRSRCWNTRWPCSFRSTTCFGCSWPTTSCGTSCHCLPSWTWSPSSLYWRSSLVGASLQSRRWFR